MKLKFLDRFKSKEVNFIEGMSKEEVDRFFAQCNSAINNKALKLIIKKLIQNQANFGVREAHKWEEVLMIRGGINMGFLIEEELEKYAVCYKDNVKAKEVFDKFNII